MKKVYYEKIGRKYLPVSEYDRDFIDSLKTGTHLVMSYPGGRSFKYNVEPAYAPMIAAGRIAEDVISNAIMKAHEIRPYQNTELSPVQKEAWDNLIAMLGDRGRYLEWPSAREVAEASVKAMTEEAVKLLENPSVKLAYEHFQLVCDLAKDNRSD